MLQSQEPSRDALTGVCHPRPVLPLDRDSLLGVWSFPIDQTMPGKRSPFLSQNESLLTWGLFFISCPQFSRFTAERVFLLTACQRWLSAAPFQPIPDTVQELHPIDGGAQVTPVFRFSRWFPSVVIAVLPPPLEQHCRILLPFSWSTCRTYSLLEGLLGFKDRSGISKMLLTRDVRVAFENPQRITI